VHQLAGDTLRTVVAATGIEAPGSLRRGDRRHRPALMMTIGAPRRPAVRRGSVRQLAGRISRTVVAATGIEAPGSPRRGDRRHRPALPVTISAPRRPAARSGDVQQLAGGTPARLVFPRGVPPFGYRHQRLTDAENTRTPRRIKGSEAARRASGSFLGGL
jgi:hypothetical protein